MGNRKGNFKKNLIASMFAMAFQLLQAFFVTSYIQRTIGIEAYGYISVVVGLVNVAGVLTVALTSVCSRYIVVEIQKETESKKSETFSTICGASWVLALICFVIFVIFAIFIENLMNISPEYVTQVRILLIVVSLDFIIQLLQVPFISFYYYEERLYVYYFLNIFTNLLKIISVFVIFSFGQKVTWAIYVGSSFANAFALLIYFSHYKKTYKDIKLRINLFNKMIIKDVLQSGMWVSASKLAAILLSSCSTYLVNIYIGTYMTGIYGAIAQLQSILNYLTNTLVNVFLPDMYKIFSLGDTDELVKYTSKCLKIISSVLAIVSGGLVVYGNEFMSIWITDDYLKFSELIILSTGTLFLSYSAEMINQLLITIDKTKMPALISIIAGICNLLMALLCVKVLNWGIYGIAAAQTIVGLVRSVGFFSIYAAKETKSNRFTFLQNQIKGCIPFFMTIMVGFFLCSFVMVNTWITLIVSCVITGILVIMLCILYDKDIRNFVQAVLKGK